MEYDRAEIETCVQRVLRTTTNAREASRFLIILFGRQLPAGVNTLSPPCITFTDTLKSAIFTLTHAGLDTSLDFNVRVHA